MDECMAEVGVGVDHGRGPEQCLVKARWQENGVCSPWSVRCVVSAGRNAHLFFTPSVSGESEDCDITVD